jgi:hypothetical protein
MNYLASLYNGTNFNTFDISLVVKDRQMDMPLRFRSVAKVSTLDFRGDPRVRKPTCSPIKN